MTKLKILKIIAVLGVLATLIPLDFLANQPNEMTNHSSANAPSMTELAPAEIISSAALYVWTYCDKKPIVCDTGKAALRQAHILAIEATGVAHEWLKKNHPDKADP